MSSVVLQNESGWIIRSVEGNPDSWHVLAPPQNPNQWQAGNSAMELARLWFPNGPTNGHTVELPDAFRTLFESEQSFHGIEFDTGICEVLTRIDRFGGNTRNHDQVLLGRVGTRRTVVGVEAKADEEFGPVIRNHLLDPNGGGHPGSNIPARIELLASSIFGTQINEIDSLRYQLLHAFAATLIEAKCRGAEQAVFMICQFEQNNLNAKKVRSNANVASQNQTDYESFVQALLAQNSLEVSAGILYGPIHVPGGPYVPSDIPAYVGMVSVCLNS